MALGPPPNQNNPLLQGFPNQNSTKFKMGLQMGLEKGRFCKRENHWLFFISGISADLTPSHALPPQKSARPNLSFKEMVANHMTEDVYFPAKPEWKPINLVLYDLNTPVHPVFDWIRNVYDPYIGSFYEPNRASLIRQCTLKLCNGCGDPIETWIYEDVWPQNINFGQLDMGNSGIVMCELTLRYARAYISDPQANIDQQLAPINQPRVIS